MIFFFGSIIREMEVNRYIHSFMKKKLVFYALVD